MAEGSELLDGESPDWTPADAKHWIGVYTELVAFCQDALAVTDTGERVLLGRRLRRFQARLDFWKRGLESLKITKA